MLMYQGYVWFIRERNGSFWLIEDTRPDMELKLQGAGCMREAERIAWTLING